MCKEELEEVIISLDDKVFLGYLALKVLTDKKSTKLKVSKQDLNLIFTSYSLLMLERRNYLDCEKKLISLSNFMGLR